MPVQSILQLGNPALRRTSDPVAEPDAEDVAALAADLRDTLLAHRDRTGYGRGIAAPQLDRTRRVIHVELEGSHTLVNPRISARSEATCELWDACFSYFSIAFPVRRHLLVEVKYQDLRGRDRRLEATGHLAELKPYWPRTPMRERAPPLPRPWARLPRTRAWRSSACC
jgi:peptide deformylase